MIKTNTSQFIKKTEDVLTAYLKDEQPKKESWNSGVKKYQLYEDENTGKVLISLSNDINYMSTFLYKKDLSIQEVMDKVIENIGNKNFGINVKNTTKLRPLIRFLLKENNDELIYKFNDIFIKNIDMFGSGIEQISKISLETGKILKNVSEYKETAKFLIFNIANNIDGAVTESNMSNIHFLNIFEPLLIVDIKKNDYTPLHNFFDCFKEQITNNINCYKAFNLFLKNKINPNDWVEFIGYSKDGDVIKKSSDGLYSEQLNPIYHMIINKNYVIENNPILSLDNDYNTMITDIIKYTNLNKIELNINSCKIIGLTDKTELYFISKDNTELDSKKIKHVVEQVIDLYAEALKNKQPLTEQFLKTTFKAVILSEELSNKEPLKTNKKINKI